MADPGTLLARLGGREALASTVARLYERILDDPLVAPYFDDVDLLALRGHMVDFLLAALVGDPRLYRGRDLADAHAGLRITGPAFDCVAGHVAGAVRDAGGSSVDADEVLARIAPLRPQVVTAEV